LGSFIRPPFPLFYVFAKHKKSSTQAGLQLGITTMQQQTIEHLKIIKK